MRSRQSASWPQALVSRNRALYGSCNSGGGSQRCWSAAWAPASPQDDARVSQKTSRKSETRTFTSLTLEGTRAVTRRCLRRVTCSLPAEQLAPGLGKLLEGEGQVFPRVRGGDL